MRMWRMGTWLWQAFDWGAHPALTTPKLGGGHPHSILLGAQRSSAGSAGHQVPGEQCPSLSRLALCRAAAGGVLGGQKRRATEGLWQGDPIPPEERGSPLPPPLHSLFTRDPPSFKPASQDERPSSPRDQVHGQPQYDHGEQARGQPL